MSERPGHIDILIAFSPNSSSSKHIYRLHFHCIGTSQRRSHIFRVGMHVCKSKVFNKRREARLWNMVGKNLWCSCAYIWFSESGAFPLSRCMSRCANPVGWSKVVALKTKTGITVTSVRTHERHRCNASQVSKYP